MRRCGFDSFAPDKPRSIPAMPKPLSRAGPTSIRRPPTAARRSGRYAMAEPARERAIARNIDRIDTGPRFREADAVRLNRLFHGTDTHEMLARCCASGMAGDVAVVSSFGAESAVLLHLVARIDPAMPVLFLETGKHFPETLAYRDTLVARLGLTDVRNLAPDAGGTGRQGRKRPALVLRSRRLLRDPQGQAAGAARWPVSMRRSPGARPSSRAPAHRLPRFEIDTSDAQGRLKINPLIDWSPGRHRRLCRRARPAAASAGGRRLSLDRLLALHQQGRRGRRPARRPLARLGQDRVRHPRARRAGRRGTARGLRSGVLKGQLRRKSGWVPVLRQ